MLEEETQKMGKINLNEFIPQLKKFVESETVFGKPFEIKNVTLIPVHSVRVGFGFGNNQNKLNKELEGGGGGVSLNPIAIVVIKDDLVSIQNLSASNIEGILEKIPDFLEKTYNFSQKIFRKKDQ